MTVRKVTTMLQSDLSQHSDPSGDAPAIATVGSQSSSAPVKGGCRFCGTPLKHSVVDLGTSPLCESFLTHDQLKEA